MEIKIFNTSDGEPTPSLVTDYSLSYNIQSSSMGDDHGQLCEFLPAKFGLKFFLGVVFSMVIVVCGIGDTLLCYLILTNQRLRSVTNLLIANLAFSDALVAIFCVPLSLNYYLKQNWMWPAVLCPIVGTLKSVSLYVSVNTLLVIAIDRYHGIFHPLRPRMKKITLVIIICGIWFFSALLAVPTALHLRTISGPCHGHVITACVSLWHSALASQVYTLVIAVLEFALPMWIMGFIYFNIAVKLWFHRTPPGNVTAKHREITINRKQKTIPMLVTVVIAFLVCWAPHHGYLTAYQFISDDIDVGIQNEYTMFYVVEGIAMCNSVVSTIIYFGMSPVFRNELNLLAKRFPCWPYSESGSSFPLNSQSSNAIAGRNGYSSAGKRITADTLDSKL